MVKVFISQPMNGRTDEEILKERQIIKAAYEELRRTEIEVINSFLKEIPENVANIRVYMLGDSISLMHNADLVLFAPGYVKARGCLVEEQVAYLYGIPRLYYVKSRPRFTNARGISFINSEPAYKSTN